MPDRPKPQKPKTPKKPKPPKTRDWSWERTGDGIWCYSSDKDLCTIVRLWEGRRSEIHDAELQDATAEINRIIDRLERDNADTSRRLSFINFQGRLMLVWTHCGDVVSSYDDDAEIAKALKVKGFTAP